MLYAIVSFDELHCGWEILENVSCRQWPMVYHDTSSHKKSTTIQIISYILHLFDDQPYWLAPTTELIWTSLFMYAFIVVVA